MPKYVFSQGKVRIEDGVYNPLLDERSPDAGVILVIPPKGNLNQQVAKAIGCEGEQAHDQKEENLKTN